MPAKLPMKGFRFRFKIQTKLLVVLLVLSVTLLIVSAYAVFNTLTLMGALAVKKQEQLREYAVTQSITTLERSSEAYLTSLARDQAKIANEFFAKIEAELRSIVWIASYFWQHPELSGQHLPSYSTKEPPPDPLSATVYYLVPDLTKERVQHELDLLSNVDPYLIAIYKNYPEVAAYIATATGITRFAPWDLKKSGDFDPRVRPWYQAAIQAGKLQWTEPYRDLFTNELMMTCSAPFFSTDHKIAGVVGFDVLLIVLIDKVMSTQIGEVGYAFLVDPVGKLIASSGGLFKSKATQATAVVSLGHDVYADRVNLTEVGSKDQRGVVQAMIRGQDGFQRIQTGMRKVKYEEYIAYAPVPATGWSLGVVMPVEKVLAPARALEREINKTSELTKQEVDRQRMKIRALMAGVFILALGATIYTAFALAKRITRPILALHEGVHTVGQGHLDYQIVVSTGDELEDLAQAFNQMTGDLKKYLRDLETTTAATKKFETELEIGRQIQQSLLPQTLPQLDGWEIVGSVEPAREVAGDFYDVFMLEETGMVFFVVADVCDKGVGPAMFAAVIRTLLRAFSSNYSHLADPTAMDAHLPLTRANDFIVLNQAETSMFATVFAGVLDPQTGVIRYVNCGHNPPYVISGDHQIRAKLKATGPVLGPMPDITYTIKEETLQPGEVLFIYTDGLPEAHAPDGAFFTDKQVEQMIVEPVSSAAELLDRTLQRVCAHISTAEQFDDITLMVIRRIV